jgi:hypothetical protein
MGSSRVLGTHVSMSCSRSASLLDWLFIPALTIAEEEQAFAQFTPMYGVGHLARAPLVGGATAAAIVSVLSRRLLFGVGAMMMFRRDTSRVRCALRVTAKSRSIAAIAYAVRRGCSQVLARIDTVSAVHAINSVWAGLLFYPG